MPLEGKVAVVAGSTRGAGRGIARALGEAGARVYCTGRSVRGHPATPNRPETIDETAEIINAAGGTAHAVCVDHSDVEQVEALFERVRRELVSVKIVKVPGTHKDFVFTSREQVVSAMLRFLGGTEKGF